MLRAVLMIDHLKLNACALRLAFVLLLMCSFAITKAQEPALDDPQVQIEDSVLVELPMFDVPERDEMVLAKVVRVIDGDSVILHIDGVNRRYQVLGANCHEIRTNRKKQDPSALRAKWFVEQFILDEQVYIQHDPLGARDGAKRFSGYMFRVPDMSCVNLELIRQGYAELSDGHMSIYHDMFRVYEQRAKELERGIWSPIKRGIALPQEEPDLVIENEEQVESEPVHQNNEKPDPEPPSKGTVRDGFVFTTKSGKKYHLSTCRYTKDDSVRISREKIDPGLSPCKTCRPDG